MAVGQRDEMARRRVLAELRRGSSVMASAALAGVTRQAVYNWAKRGDAEIQNLLPHTRTPLRPRPAAPAEDERLRQVTLEALEAVAGDIKASAKDRLAAAKELARYVTPELPPKPQGMTRPKPSAIIDDPPPPVDPTARFR